MYHWTQQQVDDQDPDFLSELLDMQFARQEHERLEEIKRKRRARLTSGGAEIADVPPPEDGV